MIHLQPAGHAGAHRSTTRFSHRLDAEWDRLNTHRRSRATVRTWAAQAGEPLAAIAADVTTLDELLAAIRSSRDEDAVLVALIDQARVDELAGRVAVQRILPGLTARSRRYRSYADDIDPLEIVVAAAWIAIRQFDTERRRHHVAACLISDAVFQAFRRPLRRRSTSDVLRSPDRFARNTGERPAPHPFLELAAVVREAREAGVPDHHLQLIRDLAAAESPTTVAVDRRVTTRTIRNRRDRAVASIAAALGTATWTMDAA